MPRRHNPRTHIYSTILRVIVYEWCAGVERFVADYPETPLDHSIQGVPEHSRERERHRRKNERMYEKLLNRRSGQGERDGITTEFPLSRTISVRIEGSLFPSEVSCMGLRAFFVSPPITSLEVSFNVSLCRDNDRRSE